jgi:hypothetical protein
MGVRLCRTMTAVAVAGLIGLTAACGPSDDAAAPPAATKPAATEAAAPAQAADVTVSGEGMKGGCEAVHKLFAALDSGDKAAAKILQTKAHDMFNDIAAEQATKDIQLATDAAAMASVLEFKLPDEQIYQSDLAQTYGVDCVARYGATALPS